MTPVSLSRRTTFALLAALLVLLALSTRPALAQEGAPLPTPGGLDATTSSPFAQDALGTQGTSYAFLRQYGTSRAGFIEDASHFANVSAVALEGDSLWVADAWGLRALKFSADGAFQRQIGTAGYREGGAPGVSFDYLTDVAVDAGGNVWTANGAASQVTQFAPDGSMLLTIGKPYQTGTGNDVFNNPYGIAFDGSGNIYVSDGGLWGDFGNDRVQVFSSSGAYLATIGQTGVAGADNAHLHRPRRMVAYGSLLYIADAGNHRIQIYNISNPSAPTYAATIGVSGESGSDNVRFNYPEGVFVTNEHIYVADSNNNRIQVFSRVTRAFVATLGTGAWGQGNDAFNHPSDVVVDSSGRMYVADQWNQRVQVFNNARVYQRTVGTTGVSYLTDHKHFNYPSGVAVGSDGSLYVAEQRGHRLLKLDATGNLLWSFGEAGQGGGDDNHLFFPQDVDVAEDGTVYVADSTSHRIKIIGAAGQHLATLGSDPGSGPSQFNSPSGVAAGPDGSFLVADQNNHRVQVFDRHRNLVATLGVTGQPGPDNTQFDWPWDVEVDAAGRIYVADWGNHRVQVFGANRQYLRTIGVTGECGDDFAHLCNPVAVAADSLGRVYVADSWGWRVQVFDAQGRYLTTIGRRDGSNSPQVEGIASTSGAGVYLAEGINHRVSLYGTPRDPWVQTNINGFGLPTTAVIQTLEPFQGNLYAGVTTYTGTPASTPRLYRSPDGRTWSGISSMTATFERPNITDLIEFGGQLYATTFRQQAGTRAPLGTEIYRSTNGLEWVTVVTDGFGRPENAQVGAFGLFDGFIYAGTQAYTQTATGTVYLPAEIWRSATGNSGDWQRVVTDGLGRTASWRVTEFVEYDGAFFAGVSNGETGGEVWRTVNGTDWTRLADAGLGSGSGAPSIHALAAFSDTLYVAISGSTDNRVWRCVQCTGADWEEVVGGFNKAANMYIGALEVYDGALYFAVGNPETGLEVWRTEDGDSWQAVAIQGFGDWANQYAQAPALTGFEGALYLGTANFINGSEVWQFLDRRVHLPLTQK